jgi:hypothetical protein
VVRFFYRGDRCVLANEVPEVLAAVREQRRSDARHQLASGTAARLLVHCQKRPHLQGRASANTNSILRAGFGASTGQVDRATFVNKKVFWSSAFKNASKDYEIVDALRRKLHHAGSVCQLDFVYCVPSSC